MDQLFFFLFLLLPIAALSSDLTPYEICEKNFTKNNILLQVNINILFEMVAESSLRGYAVSSYADNGRRRSETVYSVAICRGDMSVEACAACITKAAQNIRTKWTYSAKSRIWYEECFLRYDTIDFLGKADKNFPYWWNSYYAVEMNPQAFKQALGELMGEVVAAATAKGSNMLFGYGENRLNDKLTVYGMAQCTWDLGESECNACLQYALEFMRDNCQNPDTCRVFGNNCFISYDIDNSFSVNATGSLNGVERINVTFQVFAKTWCDDYSTNYASRNRRSFSPYGRRRFFDELCKSHYIDYVWMRDFDDQVLRTWRCENWVIDHVVHIEAQNLGKRQARARFGTKARVLALTECRAQVSRAGVNARDGGKEDLLCIHEKWIKPKIRAANSILCDWRNRKSFLFVRSFGPKNGASRSISSA